MAKLKIAESTSDSSGGDRPNDAADHLAEANRLLNGARAWADILSCAGCADVELDEGSLANGARLLAQTLDRITDAVDSARFARRAA